MTARQILVCTGIDLGSVVVPPFEVREQEVIVLVKPDGFAETPTLMETLAGLRDMTGLCLMGRAEPIMPWKTFGAGKAVDRQKSVWNNLQCAGVPSRETAEELILGLRTELDDALGIAHYTDKVVLGIRLARWRGADIVIVMGAGLDPLGTRAVLSELRRPPGTAIVLIGNNLIDDSEYDGAFIRRVDLVRNDA